MARWPESLAVATDARTEAVVLRRSARARRLQLRVGAEGAELVVPNRGTLAQAQAFLNERSLWVLDALDEQRRKHAKREAHREETLPTNAVLLDGAWLTVEIAPLGTTHRRGGVSVDTDRNVLQVRLPITGQADATELIERFLQRRARREIADGLERWAPTMGVTYNRLFVRDQKTRWASCSGRGNLSFSWRLICLPPSVREYVIIHELAHLTHMNHSAEFWREVERYCPAFDTHRAHLKAHGWLTRDPIRLENSPAARV
jgi:predicted metal-dependent hydrolase